LQVFIIKVTMSQLVKKLLREALTVPSFRVPKDIKFSNDEKLALKNVSWEDLKIEDLGGSGNIAHLGINLPFESAASDAIVVDIQVIKDMIYQIHMHLPEDLRGLGLGYKIYKAVIHDLGHLYSGKGRRLNQMVAKIWDILKNDPDFECVSSELGDLCMVKNHPNKEELTQFVVG
jgi:hypothetical protein